MTPPSVCTQHGGDYFIAMLIAQWIENLKLSVNYWFKSPGYSKKRNHAKTEPNEYRTSLDKTEPNINKDYTKSIHIIWLKCHQMHGLITQC